MKTHEILTRSETNEWYTPPNIIELARQVLGTIDLDPASNLKAQTWIQAQTFYTKDDDGFNQPWEGNVWLNPPYGQESKEKGILGASAWIKKALSEYLAGNIESCVLLVRGDSEGLKHLRRHSLTCFPKKRILFLKPDGNPGDRPVPGSEIHYLGPDRQRFLEVFKDFGDCFVQFNDVQTSLSEIPVVETLETLKRYSYRLACEVKESSQGSLTTDEVLKDACLKANHTFKERLVMTTGLVADLEKGLQNTLHNILLQWKDNETIGDDIKAILENRLEELEI